jgi:hypothetical protein
LGYFPEQNGKGPGRVERAGFEEMKRMVAGRRKTAEEEEDLEEVDRNGAARTRPAIGQELCRWGTHGPEGAVPNWRERPFSGTVSGAGTS